MLKQSLQIGRTGGLKALAMIIAGCVLVSGCTSTDKDSPAETTMAEYGRPLRPGERALRKVNDPSTVRRLARTVHASNDPLLIQALEGSKDWYNMPSAKTHFPIEDITWARAQRTVDRLTEILRTKPSRDAFVSTIEREFDLYQSVGWDGYGTVLFTGYCALEFDASLEPSGDFMYPLYRRPSDLVSDERTGKPLGQKMSNGSIRPYPSREEIEASNMLAGSELVYLAHPLDAYIIHVNGSAKLKLRNGDIMYVGYAGKTDREYRSLGKAMIDRGLIDPAKMSLKAIRDHYRFDTAGLQDLLNVNESYVFFTQYQENSWPAGSLNVRVTEKRSLATDKSIFPRGGPMIVETQIPTYGGGVRPFTRIMVDQDTGGAIKAPGRADIYMGEGRAAEIIAGQQKREGQMYYLFLKSGG